MNRVLRLDGVTRRHHRGREVVTAVDDVSLELSAGSMTALVGPSGSGKTTLLNLIVNGDEPDSGVIEGPMTGADWSLLSIVPQALGLLPELTLAENVELPLRLGAVGSVGVAEALDLLGIGALAARPPNEASLGEQQRAAVARALITSPVLLVADEPTSHQDELNTERVLDALVDVTARGTCTLIATHDERVVERCDEVLHMSDGRVRRQR